MSDAPTTRSLTVGDPGPLGLACFALTTFVLSCYNAGLFPAQTKAVVFGLALFYGGIVQILAGLFEYFKNNTFGATAFCSYGAFWMAFWYINTQNGANKDWAAASPHLKEQAVGLFLLGWTIFTAYMTITVMRVNGGLTATFVLLLIAFICLTIGDLFGVKPATMLGGYVGILTALTAWYCSFAGVMNNTAGRAVLPMWPRTK